ncbi:MAG: HAMP domain-containing histidine kinase [Sulfurimonas sp.]|nr:HAMP domain-containing histidine kinase [Sulfurimonas sp.]MBU1217054.1 HAMP domain-containing histidine kinase [bacterium]MBU1435387.1 HAMP domain-containing histidine kinase [bacterium]MBU1502302.1 HAMP domain-containing histidine kinase [bacterium]MBU3940242.1 HAMP domain-containing histidine kinase [bacterium]
MQEDANQKIIDEIVALSKLSNPRLREQTLKLIEIYHQQKKKQEKEQQRHRKMLQVLDKRDSAIYEANTKKDKLLKQQSKMASMGEMMDAVAHQWRQPLNSISMLNDMLVDDFKNSLVDKAYIDDMTQTVHSQIEHMVSTLNEFRTFFRPSKDSCDFSIRQCIFSVEILMKDELIKNNVNVHVNIDEEIIIHGQINEFKHLFLNLLSNSIDAYNEKQIQTRNIHIRAFPKEDAIHIEFEDDALGIPDNIIKDIFKPNVTTKEDGKGTGIGLYMSSQIVQKHNGVLRVHNANNGAIFTIYIKK